MENTPNQQPQAPVTPQSDAGDKANSKKMMIMLVGGIVIAIVVAILIYILMGKGTSKAVPQQPGTSKITPVGQATTTDSLTTDLQGVQVEELDTQFSEVDKDLQSL